MLGTIWSTSSGVDAIISTLNQAYGITDSRPWWKVKTLALGLTIGLAGFIVFSLVALAIALVCYYAPDAEQEWVWMTPGSVLKAS